MSDIEPDLDAYRAAARAWLAANLEARDPRRPVRMRERGHMEPEMLASQRSLQRRLFEGGYAGISWPRQYGGQGLTAAHESVFEAEAAGYVLPDLGIAGLTTMRVCGPTLLAHASESVCKRHIPRMLRGDEIWVQFFSEPAAGSDLAGVRLRAVVRGDGWALNGAKVWTSGAYYADYGLCLARTNWEVPKHRGLTWFAVPIPSQGLTVRPIREIDGGTEFCEEFFDDVEVAADAVIGEVDQGWKVARSMMTFERSGGDPDATRRTSAVAPLAPDLVGLARAAGREKDPVVRQHIAAAHTLDVVREALEDWIVSRQQIAAMDHSASAYLKLAAGTFNPIRARLGLAVGRGSALTWRPSDASGDEFAVNYLNARVLSIAGGTNEMQRNDIGERVLGLPRERSVDVDRPFNEVLQFLERRGAR